MSWYVENAADVVESGMERARQRKGRPEAEYQRTTFNKWAHLLSRKGDSLQKALGKKVGRILGCGRYGCTVASGPRKVIKLSPLPKYGWERDEELRFWTKMKEEQERPTSPASSGVVGVDAVWVVTDEQTDERYMVILRDSVEPFSRTLDDPENPGYVLLAPTPASIERGIETFPPEVLTPDDVVYFMDEAWLDEAIGPVVVAVNEYDLGDVHIGNIGWRGNRLVIYDADYTDPAPPPDAELRVNARDEDDFEPETVTVGDTLFTPWGETIIVTKVLRPRRGTTVIYFNDPKNSKFRAGLGMPPVEDTKEFRRASDRDGWRHAPGSAYYDLDLGLDEESFGPNPGRGFYVFEMDGDTPLHQANAKPLTLAKAQQFARIGAQNGRYDRAVTTDPRRPNFRIVARYEAGV